jgi:SNF2 family DNA or RNA helicase
MNNVKFHLLHPRTGDWSDCGTGKTLTALALFTMRNKQELVNRALVVCPLSLVYTWEKEIAKHTHFSSQVLTGSLNDKIASLTNKAHFYILTYDSIPGRKGTEGKLLAALLAMHFDMLIIDEVSYVKSIKAVRTKSILYLASTIPYSISLSGTFVPNRPEQVLTVYRVMDGGKTFGKNYYTSLRVWFRNIGFGFPKWIVREDRESAFKRKLYERAVRVRKEECLDLPGKVYLERYCDLGKKQAELYKDVASKLYNEIEVDEKTADKKIKLKSLQHTLAQMNKLSQISNGFVYSEGDVAELLENPKLDLLEETLSFIPEDRKVVIYYVFKQDKVSISTLLGRSSIPFVCIDGNVDAEGREKAINSFQEGEARIILIQQSAGGFGLTLSASSNVIYFDHDQSVINWQQSQDRVHRIGQKFECNYYILMARHTVDEITFGAMIENLSVSSALQNDAFVARLKANLGMWKRE